MNNGWVIVLVALCCAFAASAPFWSRSRSSEACMKANKCWRGGDGSCMPCEKMR